MPGRQRSIRAYAAAGTLLILSSVAYLNAERAIAFATPSPMPRPLELDAVTGLSADVTIHHRALNAVGVPVRPSAAPATFRLERVRRGPNWQTSLTRKSSSSPAVRGLTGVRPLETSFVVSRMEYDGDGTPLRLYDGAGRRIKAPDAADRRFFHLPDSVRDPRWRGAGGPPRAVFPSGEWDNDVLMLPRDRDRRRQTLEARFGRPAGRVGQRDRFVRADGDVVRETLVDPAHAVPVEINSVRGGELISRVLIDYESHRGGLVRRRLRADQRMPGDVTGRSLTDVSLSDIRVTLGAGR
jgi:hypothetical protein